MTLGALVDAGLELSRLQELLESLSLPGWRLEAHPVTLHGLQGTRVTVETAAEQHPHRHLGDILRLLERSDLPDPVREKSAAVFRRLAEAEGAVHGVSPEEVHFHEVGAVDAIVDVVGSVGGLHLLGVDSVHCSPLPLGRGMTRSAHGAIPLPPPAVLELLRISRAPAYGSAVTGELVTPTGAALVTVLAEVFGPIPPLVVESVGCGAGTMDPGYPNFLRLILGRPPGGAIFHEEQACLVEANIDDLNPQIYGYLMELLFEAGAADVYFTPIQMKKNRPAVKLSVLVQPDRLQALTDILFQETSTLGVRVTGARKLVRPRQMVPVETPWGIVRVKAVPVSPGAGSRAASLHYAPEYEDCAAAARRAGLPLKEIYRQVEQLFRRERAGGSYPETEDQ